MNSSEEVLKMQRSFSVLSGTKKGCVWLMMIAVVLAVGSAIIAVRNNESIPGALAAPLILIAILALTRSSCARKLRDLEASLSQ